jgi:hypothetical protein
MKACLRKSKDAVILSAEPGMYSSRLTDYNLPFFIVQGNSAIPVSPMPRSVGPRCLVGHR